jgi:hypothetical protein
MMMRMKREQPRGWGLDDGSVYQSHIPIQPSLPSLSPAGQAKPGNENQAPHSEYVRTSM